QATIRRYSRSLEIDFQRGVEGELKGLVLLFTHWVQASGVSLRRQNRINTGVGSIIRRFRPTSKRKCGVKGPWYTIVGVVAHARASSLESDTNEGFYYFNAAQLPQLSATIVVRSSRSSADLKGDLAAAVRSVESSVPIYDVKTMEQRVDESLIGRRFVVLLLTTFAGLALLLAALGLYGVISYSVRMRTRELGVRLALGAQRGEVMQLVLLQGLRLAVVGVIFGGL